MCVCVCVCVHAFKCTIYVFKTHIDTLHYYTDMHWYNPMDEETCVCVCIYMYVCVCVCIYIYIYIVVVGALLNLKSIYFKIGKKRNNKLPKDGRRKTPTSLIILSFHHHF